MTWINLSSVSVANGSTTVTINSGLTTNVKVGDALLIGNEAPVEISGVFASQLILRSNWPNPTATNAAAAVMPTSGEFTTATQALREATNVTQGNFAEMEKWWTQLGTVTFKAYDNSEHVVRTAKEMDNAVQAQINETQAVTDNMTSLVGSEVSLSNPDTLIPFNDSLQVVRGFGTQDQIDVSAAQDGSVVVELPTKSVDFSRASARTHIDKSGDIITLAVDEPAIGNSGFEVFPSYIVESKWSEDLTNSVWTKTTGATVTQDGTQDAQGRVFNLCSVDSSQTDPRVTQVVSIKSQGSYGQFSMVVKKANTSVFVLLFGSITGGTATVPSARFNFDTESFENVSSTWERLTFKKLNSGAYLIEGVVLDNASGNTTWRLDVLRSYASDPVSDVYVSLVNIVESDSLLAHLPYQKTTSATATVSADIASIPMRNNMPAPGQPFTIAFDIPANGLLSGTPFRNNVGSTNKRFYVARGAPSNLYFYLGLGSLANCVMPSSGTMSVALRFDGQYIDVCINGVFGNKSEVQEVGYDLNSNIEFHNSSNGGISEFKVYFRALTDAEITILASVK